MKPIETLIDDIIYEVVVSAHEKFGVNYIIVEPKLKKLIEDYIVKEIYDKNN